MDSQLGRVTCADVPFQELKDMNVLGELLVENKRGITLRTLLAHTGRLLPSHASRYVC